MKIAKIHIECDWHPGVLLAYFLFFMTFLILASTYSYAQEKHSVQIKTFDQQLHPYRNIEVSINGNDYVNVGAKALAFTELSTKDLPIKTIRFKNEQLEAASWNYSKGVVEIIVRKKSYHVAKLIVRDPSHAPLANLKITFIGSKTLSVASNTEGAFEIPLGLDEKIASKEQFSISGYDVVNLAVGENVVTLTARKVESGITKNRTPAVVNKASSRQEYFKDFDLSKLDSIQSLTVFYAIFKNYQIGNMSENTKRRLDAKFNELRARLQDSLLQTRTPFIGRISDSSFVSEDIKNLLDQAARESETLTEQRDDFDEKLKIINDKLAVGIENLDVTTRSRMLSDLTRLERLLVENENRFYKNQNDYRQLINSLKEKFFNYEDLENKLSESEAQRQEEQRVFRQRLIAISAVVLLFAFLIILLISFSSALRKQKKALVIANEEIKRMNENLEGLVFQRTKLLAEANKELDTFLYRASHDLRSPLCSIAGLCNIASHLSTGELKELIDKVVRTTLGMDKLLKKLSIISEINQPSNLSTFMLPDLIQNMRLNFDRTIKDQFVDFTIDCPGDMVMYSNPNLVQVIVTNLIENALFYSSFGNFSSPQVELTVKAKGNVIEISVFDNGVGIDPTIHNRLFNMFFKGSERSRGNGLGLYIVKKSVQALDGDICIESQLGEFTRVIVNLPLKPIPPERIIFAMAE